MRYNILGNELGRVVANGAVKHAAKADVLSKKIGDNS